MPGCGAVVAAGWRLRWPRRHRPHARSEEAVPGEICVDSGGKETRESNSFFFFSDYSIFACFSFLKLNSMLLVFKHMAKPQRQ